MNKPIFSIVIGTIGHKLRFLERCLHSIEKQAIKNIEVLVVYQGDDSVRELCEKFRFNLVYKKFKKKNLSMARNWGIENASGEYIVFIDDDAFMSDNYLEKASMIIKEKKASCITGIVLRDDTKEPLGRSIKIDKSYFMGLGDLNQWMSSSTIMKKNHLEDIGLFDEEFGVGAKWPGNEDTDVYIRCLLNGHKAYFSNELIVFHPSEDWKMKNLSYNNIMKRGYERGGARSALLKKIFLNYPMKIWCLKQLIITIVFAFGAVMHSLLRFNFKFLLRDLSSLWGRIYMFIAYK